MKSIAIFLLFLSISAFSQKVEPKFVVKAPTEKKLFYDVQPTVLFLSIQQSNDSYDDYIYNKLRSLSLIKNVERKKYKDLKYFYLEFTQPLTVETAKKFFQNMNIKVFYTELNKKIYVEDLLTYDEIFIKKNMTVQEYQVNEKCWDPKYLEYYNYNVFNIKAKQQSLYSNDYIRHLFNGNVADLKDRYRNALQQRDEFLKNKSN